MVNKKTEALMKTLTTEEVVVIHAALEDKPRAVALIPLDKSLSLKNKLEKAFMLTNSINDAWYTSDKVYYIGPEKSCRSTSVGDFVLVGSDKYEYKLAGWSKVAYPDLGAAHERNLG